MSFKPFLAYSASAGSGKTFALSVRYISLLFMGESPSHILAATFTNKAAAEMRQRVVDSLRTLGAENNRAFADAISVETGIDREALLAKQPEVLKQFLATSSYIVTLDSFFASVLRSASLELGLEPDFVTKEQGTEKLETLFLEEVEAQGLLSSLVNLALNIEDKRFGKIFDLMQTFYKVDPLLPEIEAVTYSVAQQEVEVEQLRKKMMKALVDAGAADRAVKQFETTNVKVLFSKSLFAKEELGEHSWYKKCMNSEIASLYHALKEALFLWAKAKEFVVLHTLFTLYTYYRNANIGNAKVSGVLSFDDLSYFTYRLLHESISREFLYFKIDAKFKHILLDEFQDTSTLQFLLLKPLIDEIFSGQGQSEFKSFFYVGDTKQSLYRFRGGVEELFDKVAENYGVKIEPMDTNYRSSRHVVEQVNRWFADTMAGYVPQKSREGACEGYVKVMESERLMEDAVTEAKKVLALGVDVDTIAFLVSTNKDGQVLQEACLHAGIETLLKTSSSLKSMPKIAALVAMVSYLFYGEEIDAAPLLKNVGKVLEDVDLTWFSAFMSPLQVLDRLVREFGYFDNDLNILKIVEFASDFSDIPTFLEAFETSSIAVASNSLHGAKIMTIHGSKGLEFDYVIVVDKLTRQKPDTSALVYHYNDTLYIDKILYRIKGREHFDESYATMMAERQRAGHKDKKNVLYVALTRAVEGLIVVKKVKDSIFDEIDISPLELGTLHPSVQKHRRVKPPQNLPVVITNYGTQEVVHKEEEGEKDFEAILFGTALHYTLEMLGAFDKESLTIAMDALRNRYGQVLSTVEQNEIEARITMLIDTPSFQKLLTDATISKEQSLSFGGVLKQIDLLLEYEAHCIVIDYKSSKKYSIKHQNQVRFYTEAIEKLSGKRTEGIIVYLLEGEIVLQQAVR